MALSAKLLDASYHHLTSPGDLHKNVPNNHMHSLSDSEFQYYASSYYSSLRPKKLSSTSNARLLSFIPSSRARISTSSVIYDNRPMTAPAASRSPTSTSTSPSTAFASRLPSKRLSTSNA